MEIQSSPLMRTVLPEATTPRMTVRILIEKIAECMRAFRQKVRFGEPKQDPMSPEERKLRARLVLEEAVETAVALYAGTDVAERVDESQN